jgi:hypothetical protein
LLAASGIRGLPPGCTGTGNIAYQHPDLAGVGLGRLIPLAASRTCSVPAERRIFSLPIDARSFDVSLEIRSFPVWPTK